jgi:hypothetical protein
MTTYCPVCRGEVRYMVTSNSGLWRHVDDRPAVLPHDVNTYAPDRLLTNGKETEES